MNEDVRDAVGVAGDQVRGVRGEGDVAAIRADARSAVVCRGVGLGAVARDAHAPGHRLGERPHEHVRRLVGVAGHEIGGERHEGDAGAVAAHGGCRAEAIAGPATGGCAHQIAREPAAGTGAARGPRPTATAPPSGWTVSDVADGRDPQRTDSAEGMRPEREGHGAPPSRGRAARGQGVAR